MTQKQNIFDNIDLLKRVDALATQTSCSREQIIEAAIEAYLSWHEEFVVKIERGQKAAQNRQFATFSDLDRVLKKYRPT